MKRRKGRVAVAAAAAVAVTGGLFAISPRLGGIALIAIALVVLGVFAYRLL